MSIIKSQLIHSLIQQYPNLSEKEIEDSVNDILEAMSDALAEGRRIEIRGFGSFALHYRPPRSAHNPKTGAKILTQPKYSAHFKPGKELRERINQARLTNPIIDTEETAEEE